MLRAALAVLALSGCAVAGSAPNEAAQGTRDCEPKQRLAVSQTCRLRVDATRVEVPLPLTLEAGDRYRVTLEPAQRWSDAGRNPVDPLAGDDGTGNWWMTQLKPFRRMPGELYMVAGMAVADCDAFNRVCLRSQAPLGADGLPLAVHGRTVAVAVAFFANDVPLMNGNNSGAVWVNVRRLPAAAVDLSSRI